MSEDFSVNKNEIINILSANNPELTEDQLNEAFKTVMEEISTALVCGDRVELRGFGSMVVKKRESGEARNPKSGARVQVADRGSLYFRASKELIKSLNESISNDNA
jgi:integration host factor subunit beta